MYNSGLNKWDDKNMSDYARQEGIEKGEYKKALNIAHEMKKDGLPFIQI